MLPWFAKVLGEIDLLSVKQNLESDNHRIKLFSKKSIHMDENEAIPWTVDKAALRSLKQHCSSKK